MQFQSTLPVWGATAVSGCFGQLLVISIHAPRVGSDMQVRPGAVHNGYYFNPRSPWGERRQCTRGHEHRSINFNPRSPWGERLDYYNPLFANIGISIHAPRGGSDSAFRSMATSSVQFQSTLPVGGATAGSWRGCDRGHILIHAPRGGSDWAQVFHRLRRWHFNPRSPWGERPQPYPAGFHTRRDFNPRSPWGERRLVPTFTLFVSLYFNPRSPWGERLYR